MMIWARWSLFRPRIGRRRRFSRPWSASSGYWRKPPYNAKHPGPAHQTMRAHRRLNSGDLHRENFRVASPGEETSGRATITPRGHIHVDDLPELVDHPVDVAPPTGHLDVNLINPPAVADTVPARTAKVDHPGGQVAGGISPPGPHRSVREPLGSYGSCHPGRQARWIEGIHLQCANMRGYLLVIPCQHTRAFFLLRSRLYFLRTQPIK